MRIASKIYVPIFVLVLACLPARADIGLLLNAQPNDHIEISIGQITGEGHSAVYMSRVCAASPVQLRLCGPGEEGSVIQAYEDYEEDRPFEWNVVPLSMYLYGVDRLSEKPLFASQQLRLALQQRYRATHLAEICTTQKCISDPNANWRDAVAAAFVREIYIFQVHTTVEQDAEFIRQFNVRANVNHYSGFSWNCADFAKLVMNVYFPHSAHRDVINDFGVSGPKAIARSFSHYAEHHPELDFRVIRIAQLPGSYRHSSDCHEGTEQTFRSKKWLIPVAALEVQAVPVLAASYLLTGRFDPNRELRKFPSERAGWLQEQLSDAKHDGDKDAQQALRQQLQDERATELGVERQWQDYRNRFNEVLRTAIDDGVIADQHQLTTLFTQFRTHGSIYVESDEQPWLEMTNNGRVRRVGLTAQNIFSPESDQELALQLLLARTHALLAANSKHRELLPDFESDWRLLQHAEQLAHVRSAPQIASRILR